MSTPSSSCSTISLPLVDPAYESHPTLCRVLSDNSPPPYTLASFSSFLAKNFCSEVLDFTTDVIAYRNTYSLLQGFDGSEQSRTTIATKSWNLWNKIIEMYIAPNSCREINIPGTERKGLLAIGERAGGQSEPPSPEVLQASYDMMYDLLGGIFVQFVESIEAKGNGRKECW
jgi:hypothetical protein